MTERCTAIKKDGSRCAKDAEPGKHRCWSHDPANEEERRRIAARGGRASTAVLALPPLDAMRLRSSSLAGSCDQHSALPGSASFEQRLPSFLIAVQRSVNWHLPYLGTRSASTYPYLLPLLPCTHYTTLDCSVTA